MFSKAVREREKNVSLIRLISAHDTALISVIMGYWATETCCQGVGRALFVSLSCFFFLLLLLLTICSTTSSAPPAHKRCT